MSTRLVVRHPRPEDLEAVMLLADRCWPHPYFEKPARRALTTQAKCCWVVIEYDVFIAYLATEPADDALRIIDLAVHFKHRGEGMGQKLLRLAQHTATAKGLAKLVVEIPELERGGINWLVRRGFKGVGVRRHKYTAADQDAFVLTCPVGQLKLNPKQVGQPANNEVKDGPALGGRDCEGRGE